MATSLPIPLEFHLPDGWQAAPPDEVGAPGAAFVALHPATNRPGFTTNITIDGEYRSPSVPLSELAEESVHQLQGDSRNIWLKERSEFGSAEYPGISQTVELSTDKSGAWQNLTQCQVYLSMSDTEAPEHHAVIQLVMTATTDQFYGLVPDFQEFIASVRPDRAADS